MKLFRLGGDDFRTWDVDGTQAGRAELYVDAATGVLYALSQDQRNDLDPRWRDRKVSSSD